VGKATRWVNSADRSSVVFHCSGDIFTDAQSLAARCSVCLG
jgi:hypothetical protein